MASKKHEEEGREPLLELESFSPDRPKVAINKVAYAMRLPEEFSLRERRELQKQARAIHAIRVPADATDLELDEAEAAIDAAFTMGFPEVPADVRGKMLTEHKRVFVDAFLQRFFETTAIIQSAEETERQMTTLQTQLNRSRIGRSTGGTSSQTFSGTTGAQVA